MICYTIFHWWKEWGGQFSLPPVCRKTVSYQFCRLCHAYREKKIKYSKKQLQQLEDDYNLRLKPIVDELTEILSGQRYPSDDQNDLLK